MISQYEKLIEGLNDITIDEIIRISKELLPLPYKSRPWEHVGNHGIDILSTECQLYAYMAAYGEMHKIKCRAAFQNFPFDALLTNFEVVDWGCGQGLASLCFTEMLKERDKLRLLQKVTLIEPSKLALYRAAINMKNAIKNEVETSSINKYLPGDGVCDEVVSIDYTHKIVVHLFSNILDILSIDLIKLARVVSAPGHKHYIMCMGCNNTNSYRIDRFCSIFNVSEYISDIKIHEFGLTTDTHHSFSCRTKCIEYTGSQLTTEKMLDYTEPTLVDNRPIYDDYDPLLFAQNDITTKDACTLYMMIQNLLDEKDSIFFRPNINGDTPDIVVIRPHKGIIIIHVFNDDISQYELLYEKGLIRTPDKRECVAPFVTVSSYKENLMKLHINSLFSKSLEEKKYWSVIKEIVYFPQNINKDIFSFFKEYTIKHPYGCRLLGKDYFNNEDNKKKFFYECGIEYNNKYFDDDTYNNFLRIISSEWHSYKQGKHMVLNPIQEELSNSIANKKQKINGIAGSGKTQVLVNRAIKAQLRTGSKILILTYNISLVNYIKHRLNEVRADFSWRQFYITNYHQFFKMESIRHGLHCNINSYDNTLHFETVKSKTERYPVILIDEIQDYTSDWLTIIDKYFLSPDGELVVFGDAKQNIYQRPIDTQGNIRIGIIPGSWNDSLNRSFRFTNTHLTSLILQFQHIFFTKVDNIQPIQASLFACYCKYYFINKTIEVDRLVKNCLYLIQKFDLQTEETVILSQSVEVLREVDISYRLITHQETMTTFESKEEYEIIQSSNENEQKDMEDIRRNKKFHFTMNTHRLKISTIHSYKGWEAKSIILILGPDINSHELVYTALTRAKDNLFIINMGNKKYHDFFGSVKK
jgi:hypothetical protein